MYLPFINETLNFNMYTLTENTRKQLFGRAP